MTLDEIRAGQADDVTLTSDHMQWAFLTSVRPPTARRGYFTNASPEERRMARQARRTA